MTFWFQILIFGLTGLIIYIAVFFVVPRLVSSGVNLIVAFFGALWLPALALLPLSLHFFVTLEGGSLTTSAIIERFRLHPIKTGDLWWILLAVVITVVADQLFEPLGKIFARKKPFAPPAYLPAPFNPLRKMALPPQEFFGLALPGNWKLLLVFVPVHTLAMFSEEMMWRGYFLPLQEMMFGGFAWVVNGLLWAWLVHAVLKWHFIGMLPGMLVAPFIAQLTQSTWAAFIVHAVPNSLLWFLLLWGILTKKGSDKG